MNQPLGSPLDPTEVIVGSTPAIRELRSQIRRLAGFDAVRSPHVPTVLLWGETGTGKGLAARALHDSGPRAAGPFVDVNCAAIPETMLEAELFGYEAGAFTDAKKAKLGLFAAASGGCLFLDEIDSLSLPLQGKLLKSIEEKCIRRLGAVTAQAVDVKLIAATQSDLGELVAAGRFRADLYHRLAVVVLALPALRDRVDDIVPLARHYLARYADAHGVGPRALDASAEAWLRRHSWPGNVRELGNLMERVTLLATEATITAAILERLGVHLPANPAPAARAAPAIGSAAQESAADRDADDDAIRDALNRTGGNVARAARLLGIGRNALRYRMRRLSIDRPGLEEGPGAAPHPAISTQSAATQDASPAPRWEEKTAAILAVELVFPRTAETAAQSDPWTLATRWQRRIEELVTGFGGQMLHRSPSRLTAVFGVPRALEQTPQRAVQAALAVQRAGNDARRAGETVPELRYAAHLGAVRVDVAAPSGELALLPLGDAVALPERLLGHAGDGEILVSAQIGRRVSDTCDIEERRLHLGDAARTAVYAIAASRRAAAAAAPAATSCFIGRARELEFLRDSFRRAAEGGGQLAFVVGDAGIGKSRLLREFQQGLGEGTHLWIEGRCAAYGSKTAFLPVIDAVRRYFEFDDRDDEASVQAKVAGRIAALDADLAWTVPFVNHLLSLPADSRVTALDSASRRSETLRALKTILLREAERQPVVLVVEDLHWIDEASEEFLAVLAETIPTTRVLLICSYRPGYQQRFGDRSYHLRLGLTPLSRDETAEIAGVALGVAALPRDLRELIARKAEGNPFFVEEITASLLEDGSLRRVNGSVELTRDPGQLDVPDTIQDVLIARIDRLPDDSKRAIQVASVIGREFALRLLARISEAGDTVQNRVDELRALELIYEKAIHPELAYMFKHALTHDVAYHSVEQAQRVRLHQVIGLTIEELYKERLAEHYETLAHHFELGESWQRAFRYHELAAEKAAEAHANHSVVHHTRSALRLGIRLGAAFDEKRESALEERLGLALFYLSEYGESGRAYERAAARAAASERRATLLVCASLSYFWAHEYERATRTCDSTLELSRRDGITAVESAALYLRGTSAGITEGDIETFTRMCGSALVLERESGSDFAAALGCFVQAELYEWTADYRQAVAVAERGIGIGRKLRLSHFIVWPMWFGGKALCCLGEYSLAHAWLREAFEICDRIGDRAWRSRLLNTLGWLYAEMGDIETAAEHNRRAAAIAHEFGDFEIIANSEINLALNRLALGDRGGAEAIIGPLRQGIDAPGDPWMRWRFALHAMEANARLALAKGDPETALRESRQAQERAARHRAVKLEARAALSGGRALLELERRDEARAATGFAIELARRIGHPRAEHRGLLQLASIALRCGDRDEARALSAQANAVRETIAARAPDGDLRKALSRATE